jgi:hypothetical protein
MILARWLCSQPELCELLQNPKSALLSERVTSWIINRNILNVFPWEEISTMRLSVEWISTVTGKSNLKAIDASDEGGRS